ncbi:MAG: hypothetical protein IPO08_22685 [Xanthomonadales bacterium]|nr:hypothetical protein [Xanthomonadales bacterium]
MDILQSTLNDNYRLGQEVNAILDELGITPKEIIAAWRKSKGISRKAYHEKYMDHVLHDHIVPDEPAIY